MNGQLSNSLAPLGTSGNRIVNLTTGQQVLLRGVNRSGPEYCGPDDQGFLPELLSPALKSISSSTSGARTSSGSPLTRTSFCEAALAIQPKSIKRQSIRSSSGPRRRAPTPCSISSG